MKDNAWEIEDFLEVKENRLHIDGVDTVELARQYGAPLFVFSESRIRHNIARLERVRDVIDCPLKICYAAKAMSTMGILRVVRECGIDIEVNSGGELWKALEIGFRGDQIIFNGTSKEVWEIENAINAEIYAIDRRNRKAARQAGKRQSPARAGDRIRHAFRLADRPPHIEVRDDARRSVFGFA
jgi:diaminopimelate decarboxylase